MDNHSSPDQKLDDIKKELVAIREELALIRENSKKPYLFTMIEKFLAGFIVVAFVSWIISLFLLPFLK